MLLTRAAMVRLKTIATEPVHEEHIHIPNWNVDRIEEVPREANNMKSKRILVTAAPKNLLMTSGYWPISVPGNRCTQSTLLPMSIFYGGYKHMAMTHFEWCEKQTGCINPGCKPCTMCKKAWTSSLLNSLKFTCVKCDCPVDEHDHFCRNCGFKITQTNSLKNKRLKWCSVSCARYNRSSALARDSFFLKSFSIPINIKPYQTLLQNYAHTSKTLCSH